MAEINSQGNIQGKMANLIAYKRRDSDKIFIRSKPTVSKNKIKKDPSREGTRQNYREFGGRSSGSKEIRRVLEPLHVIVDTNIAPALAGKLTPLQKLDAKSPRGQRDVCLTRDPHLLEGFQLNKKSQFESVVRAPIEAELSRQEFTARIEIPLLKTGKLFLPQLTHSYFRMIISFGMVPDLFWKKESEYERNPGTRIFKTQVWESPWLATAKGLEAQSLELKIPSSKTNQQFSLLLAIGISYGKPAETGEVEAVRYTGAGKIWKGL